MFERFRRRVHTRATDVSLLTNAINLLRSARMTGTAVGYDELPITQGIASLVADTLASMPLVGYDLEAFRAAGPDRFRRRNAGEFDLKSQPAVLRRPDPDEDAGETVHKLAQAMFWTGTGYALNGPRDRPDGEVEAITVLNPDSVSPNIDPRHDLKVASWNVNGAQYGRREVTAWPYTNDPRRGPLGESPLRRCSGALAAYGWAYSYLADYFQLGGNPYQTFRSALALSPEKITELVDEWVTARQTHRPPFLPTWLELEVPPASGEIPAVVSVLEFASAETARMCNVPVSLVNAPVAGYTLQYSNVADEFRRWLVVSLRTTWIRRMERGFTSLCRQGVAARLDASELFDGLEPATTAGGQVSVDMVGQR
jgi:phage portal protein BeeE